MDIKTSLTVFYFIGGIMALIGAIIVYFIKKKK